MRENRPAEEQQVGDDLHFAAILGCGIWPMQVDWVRVWTKHPRSVP